MADNWRVLDFSSFKGLLRFNKKTRCLMVVYDETGEVLEHGLRDVNIVFIGVGVALESGVAYHFANNDVVVIFCDWKGLPISGMYPWIDAHGRVAARQRAQAALSMPRSKNAWMRIIKAKINGQAHNIKALGINDHSRLSSLAAEVRSGDPTNREAQAAKLYWRLLFNNPAFTRTPGSKTGGKNALLDYGYSILRGHSMRAVLSAGLTPALGLFHKGRSNAFALADDFIEPFRPAVDFIVATMAEDASLDDPQVKKGLLNATTTRFTADGATIPTVLTDLTQQFGRYVENEVEALDVPAWGSV